MALLNGQPVDPAALSTLALTNYGHFTTMRVEEGRVRGLGRHLERLVRDCGRVFGVRLDPGRVRALVREVVGARVGAFVVRVTVFDPALDLGRPAAAGDPQVLVTERAAATAPLPPLRVRTVGYQRDLARVKHTGLFGALHHRRAAQLAGYDDALFVSPADGVVSEGGTWSAGFVRADGQVVWPDAEVLPGVTMALLQEVHPYTVVPVGAGELPGMRAAFAANTAFGVRPLCGIDEIPLAVDDPVLSALRDAYLAVPGERL